MHGLSGLPGGLAAVAPPVALQRAIGVGRARVTTTGIAQLYQEGSLRLRPMRVAGPPEIVAINTAGGLTGGDSVDLTVQVDAGAGAVVTTPACEKVYRSAGGEASVTNAVAVAAGARLDWLPQPMILFDGARIRRSLDLALAADATVLAVEGCILGRTAMDEDVTSGSIHDAWRIRRDGALILADAFRADGNMRIGLASTATLRGARALATVVYVAPDAEARLDAAREMLATAQSETGASAWNGVLVARILAPDGGILVADLASFLGSFRDTALPRSWLC